MSSLISLYKYWKTLKGKKKFVLTLWILHFPLLFFWTVVVFMGFFTRVEVPSLIHFVTWIIIAFDFFIGPTLGSDETVKHLTKEILNLRRGKQNAAG